MPLMIGSGKQASAFDWIQNFIFSSPPTKSKSHSSILGKQQPMLFVLSESNVHEMLAVTRPIILMRAIE
jgi:hypothetical protein